MLIPIDQLLNISLICREKKKEKEREELWKKLDTLELSTNSTQKIIA